MWRHHATLQPCAVSTRLTPQLTLLVLPPPPPWQVGVSMPSATARVNSLGEVQRIAVAGIQRPRVVSLKYLVPVATPTLTTVTITTDDVAKFEDESILLRLIINGVNVTFPISWLGNMIDNTIEARLLGQFSANDLNFGVYKVGHCESCAVAVACMHAAWMNSTDPACGHPGMRASRGLLFSPRVCAAQPKQK